MGSETRSDRQELQELASVPEAPETQKFVTEYLKPLASKIKHRDFAVYDIETITDLTKAYLLGFYDGKSYTLFERNVDGSSIADYPETDCGAVDRFLQWLTSTGRRYTKTWIYAHNAGNFDALYILRWFLDHQDRFRLELTPLNSSILILTVHSKSDRHAKWTFIDSYRLMSAKLDAIGKAFGLGQKVKIYECSCDPKKEDCERCQSAAYETLQSNPKRYEYLERDCKLLYSCLERFYELIYSVGGDIGITAPSTSMLTFRRRFLNHDIPINRHFIGCSNSECRGCLHEFVRRGYYGGRVEVFTEEFISRGPDDVLYFGDVNSMYPAQMLRQMPVTLQAQVIGACDLERLSRHWLGFVECNVNVPRETYLPVLPLRHDGKLIFPTGVFSSVWTSEELREAVRNGATIERVVKSVWFSGATVFDAYVNHMYRYRDKTLPGHDPGLDLIAKLLLNSLYGKMGMNETREKLWFFPSNQDIYEHPLRPLNELGDGIYTEEVTARATYVIPHIAAWVTALSRLALFRLMRGMLNEGYRIFYCDTDSIATNKPIIDDKALGALKTEKIEREYARFAAPKLYYLKSNASVKAKGFGGGFGGARMDGSLFDKIVNHREKMEISRMRKYREGLRADERFPSMMHMQKGIKNLDEKRVHLGNGETMPIHLMEVA